MTQKQYKKVKRIISRAAFNDRMHPGCLRDIWFEHVVNILDMRCGTCVGRLKSKKPGCVHCIKYNAEVPESHLCKYWW